MSEKICDKCGEQIINSLNRDFDGMCFTCWSGNEEENNILKHRIIIRTADKEDIDEIIKYLKTPFLFSESYIRYEVE